MMTMKSWGSFMTATHVDGQRNTQDKMANKQAKPETKTAHSTPMFGA
jgi:hypothetical protein